MGNPVDLMSGPVVVELYQGATQDCIYAELVGPERAQLAEMTVEDAVHYVMQHYKRSAIADSIRNGLEEVLHPRHGPGSVIFKVNHQDFNLVVDSSGNVIADQTQEKINDSRFFRHAMDEGENPYWLCRIRVDDVSSVFPPRISQIDINPENPMPAEIRVYTEDLSNKMISIPDNYIAVRYEKPEDLERAANMSVMEAVTNVMQTHEQSPAADSVKADLESVLKSGDVEFGIWTHEEAPQNNINAGNFLLMVDREGKPYLLCAVRVYSKKETDTANSS